LNTARQPVGSLEVALGHALRLLAQNPDLAAEQATEILHAMPAHPRARLILGAAHRRAGRLGPALEVLEPLVREQPRSVPALLELALAQASADRAREAVHQLRRAVALDPKSVDGWRLLADTLDLVGDAEGADRARARHLECATQDPRLIGAAKALIANDLPVADAQLRKHLEAYPKDVAALRMLAEVAGRLRRYADSQELLEKCLRLAPGFDAARHNYAVVLNRQGKAGMALPQVQQLIAKDPQNPSYLSLQASILAHLGDYAESIEIYGRVLDAFPAQAKIWMSYGHALKTAGRREDSIGAYRRAIALEPALGEAYWSLANLKTFRFSADEIQAMQLALARTDLSSEDRLHLDFALGKAYEDLAEHTRAFAHYAAGNALRRQLKPYDADRHTRFVQRSKALFTAEFFARRRDAAAADADPRPIFIVGLPRAGSTLIEQILASHSHVEGTIELPDLPQIALELAGRRGGEEDTGFLEAVAALSAEERRALGRRYLEQTRAHRKTAAPFFIDKMPNNFLYIGLIELILPQATIIDARRHPLGCCLSAFKQHFARGQNFAYDLDDLGRYYRDYTDLMAHFDAVLPGRVQRVFYERMVEDTEGEIRRLLGHCGLAFEPACLKFHENPRAVRTASSEQVRRPVFRDGLDQWRHFEPHLGALKAALGPALTNYPGVPQRFCVQ